MVDPSGHLAFFIITALIGAAVGMSIGLYIGASASTTAAISTVATWGCYAVATGVGACALSNAGEILTGTNVIRDGLMNGNQEAYDAVQTGLSLASTGIFNMAAANSQELANSINKRIDNICSRLTKSKLFDANSGYGISIGNTEKESRGRIELFYRYSSGDGGTFVSVNDKQGKCIFRIDWDPRDGFHTHR